MCWTEENLSYLLVSSTRSETVPGKKTPYLRELDIGNTEASRARPSYLARSPWLPYFAPQSPMLYAIDQENVVTPRWRSVIFFADTERLDKAGWDIMKATYWADTVEDNDRCRLVFMIGVINNATSPNLAKRYPYKSRGPAVMVVCPTSIR